MLALALAAVLTCSMAGSAVAAQVVKGTASSFKPARLSIGRGTKVIWKSTGGKHTVTAYGGGWSKDSVFKAGDPTSFVFNQNGTYRYFCRFHASVVNGQCSGMCGSVTVG